MRDCFALVRMGGMPNNNNSLVWGASSSKLQYYDPQFSSDHVSHAKLVAIA